ncbi:HEAT repeat domain-containing protein [Nocardioides aquiterrae]|uniref:HEAT repeat domain-containing protein n=1 Tax=Nocardioides aquiterrae TaxID=203799 RepID=A0ABN1UJX7_9ACTN
MIGLGARGADPGIRERLRRQASDDRWRVREAVATALQRIGETDLPAVEDIVRQNLTKKRLARLL